MIDLRSDTVTKPTTSMLHAMAEAEVGDDVFGEDPTVNRLEKKIAAQFGFEAGVFVPSGTMGNQLSINVLSSPGDEVLIEEKGHMFNYESSAAAHLSSIQLRTVTGTQGKLTADLLRTLPRGNFEWEPRTRIIVVENTTNKGGGCCYSKKELLEIREFADENNLSVHIDGARIWNAVSATGIPPDFFGSVADTMSVCFSKGLGAPIGSMMLSSKINIKEARRIRKMWGGGMRQVGLLAAAAEYAVEHHWMYLKEDHRRARLLAETISECKKLSIDPDSVETNIVIFNTSGQPAEEAVARLEEEGVRMVPFGPNTIRATFHHEITNEDLIHTQKIIRKLFG